MDKNKKISITTNIILLIWFLLNMIGMNIGNKILVTRSYQDDGVFFIIFAIGLAWFIFKDKVGKYVLAGWLFMWLITQVYSHWYYTIFGPWDEKNNYFADTIKLIPASNMYIPDFYHIVLHILIIVALISVVSYWRKDLKWKKSSQ